MTHTPAPWYVGAQNDMLYIIDRSPRPSNDDINPNVDIEPIAKVYRPREATFETEQANARLIAAAPELLEALQEISKGAGAYDRDPLIHAENVIEDMKGIARAAITKATGKE